MVTMVSPTTVLGLLMTPSYRASGWSTTACTLVLIRDGQCCLTRCCEGLLLYMQVPNRASHDQ